MENKVKDFNGHWNRNVRTVGVAMLIISFLIGAWIGIFLMCALFISKERRERW